MFLNRSPSPAETLGELGDHDPGFDEAYCELLDPLLERLGSRR
jgi:hypothetical protein